ncbi:MAG: magnesium/cobalt transporter CorA [bacterium]|nr:magnesium/cobalt transporter CorA [bacterium]
MASKRKRSSAAIKRGQAPGSLIYVGERSDESVNISRIWYTESEVLESSFGLNELDATLALLPDAGVNWINIIGVHDVDVVTKIGRHFGIHNLHLEDIMNTRHRPKFEEHAGYLFITLAMALRDGPDLRYENVNLVLVGNTVLLFQEQSGDVFDGVRHRIQMAKGVVRAKKADYLLAILLDAVADEYLLVLADFQVIMDGHEDAVFSAPSQDTLIAVKQLKNDVSKLHQAALPLKDILGRLVRLDSGLVEKKSFKYFSDVADSVVQSVDGTSAIKDSIGDLVNTYVSLLSIKMNNIMQALTIVATIFIPLTFLVGIYGMNFKVMNELEWVFGYPALLGVMVVIVAGMVAFFRRKNWL